MHDNGVVGGVSLNAGRYKSNKGAMAKATTEAAKL